MLFRDNKGNIINISRLNYNDDKVYYNKLRSNIKSANKINDNFHIENTSQYKLLLNQLK